MQRMPAIAAVTASTPPCEPALPIVPPPQDDNELATVIAHEIAHVVARHSAEKITCVYQSIVYVLRMLSM